MQHTSFHPAQNFRIESRLVKNIAETISEEIATKMYYKLLMLKFIPEIKAIEAGKLRALKGKEAEKFLREL